MSQRVSTHATKGARLVLQPDGKSYMDIRTGFIFRLTINELMKFITINHLPFKARYTGYVSALPQYLGVKLVNEAQDVVYPMSAYNGFKGRDTDEVTLKDSGLRSGAKPYLGTIDCVVRFVLSPEEKRLLGI